MRIRFEIQSLSALGSGVHRLPINCWRLTVQYQAARPPSLIDGADITLDLQDAQGGSHLAQFTVGGVILPNGAHLNLDQVLTVSVPPDNFVQGVLIYEYLEP
jgi:hypothetical protein